MSRTPIRFSFAVSILCIVMLLPLVVEGRSLFSVQSRLRLFVDCLHGSDTNNGTSPQSPLGTIDGALHVIAQRCASSGKIGDVDVEMASGACHLQNTLEITGNLTTCVSSLRFKSHAGSAVISGGSLVPFAQNSKVPSLYSAFIGNSEFPQLFVWSLWLPQQLRGGSRDAAGPPYKRIPLAATPNLRYQKIAFPPTGVNPHNRTTLQFNASSISPLLNLTPENSSRVLNQTYVRIYHSWTSSESRVHSWDASSMLLTLAGVVRSQFLTASGSRYALLNFLDCAAPPETIAEHLGTFGYGVCQFNATHRQIVASLPRNVSLDRVSIQLVVPRLRTILDISGSASRVEFGEGLSFMHSVSGMDESCLGGCSQSGTNLRGATVTVGGDVTYVKFKRAVFAHTGGYALWIGEWSSNIEVDHCHFYDLGAGGVRVGVARSGRAPDESKMANAIAISSCIIEDGGHVEEAGCGILLQQARNASLAHNDIHHLKYTGISTGWTWGYAPTSNSDIYVGFNHIHDIGMSLLSDMGCIYNLGTTPRTVFDNNLCHDVRSFGYGGWGLYSDEGTSDVLWTNNIVYRTTGAGYHHHYGLAVRIDNNVFADPFSGTENWQSDKACIRTDPPHQSNFVLTHTICYQTDARSSLFAGRFQHGFDNTTMDMNVYWNTEIGPSNLVFPNNGNFNSWQALGYDKHSMCTDPRFVAPASYDFSRMDIDSPARKLGFKPIDISTVGPFP